MSINILEDTEEESSETIIVQFSASTDNVTISDNLTITIDDDDTIANVSGAPVITNAAVTGSGVIYDNGTDNITYYTPTYPPSLFFTSTEAGTLTLSPTTCIAGSVSVESGNNTIALNTSETVFIPVAPLSRTW